MITVDELLATEVAYIQEHKDDPIMYFNEEYHEFMPYMDGTNLDFLKKGYIKKHHQSIDKFSVDENLAFEKYGITDIEKLILLLFEGFLSQIFRIDSYYGNVPQLVEEMCKCLDELLKKAPSFEGRVLYRFCHADDKTDFEIEDIFIPTYFLTTTFDNWNKDTPTYIITPLPKELTAAKCLYLLKNHGGENQVSFQRNTKFICKKIENDPLSGQTKIYLKETIG